MGVGWRASFFDLLMQQLSQNASMSPEQQEDIQQKASPEQYVFGVCAQHLNPEDLMMVAQVIQNMKALKRHTAGRDVSQNHEDAAGHGRRSTAKWARVCR